MDSLWGSNDVGYIFEHPPQVQETGRRIEYTTSDIDLRQSTSYREESGIPLVRVTTCHHDLKKLQTVKRKPRKCGGKENQTDHSTCLKRHQVAHLSKETSYIVRRIYSY